jgi:hypothetical protein
MGPRITIIGGGSYQWSAVGALAARIDHDRVGGMTDTMSVATSRWLPQFA